MSVFEVVGSSDRRSLIKRFERKSKSEAIRELLDFLDCGWRRIDLLEKENEQLRAGVKGDFDLDAWLDWAKEAKALREENAALRSQLVAVQTR